MCSPGNGTLGIAIDHVSHDDGYQNMTMLGVEYGFRTDCENINNDLLLMSGYLYHIACPILVRRWATVPAPTCRTRAMSAPAAG